MDRARAAEGLWLVTSGILVWMAAVVTVAVALSFLGAPPSAVAAAVASLLCLAWLAFRARRAVPVAASAAAVAALIALSAVLAAALPDLSSDGLSYHQPSIAEISGGWDFLRDMGEGERPFWTVYYSKGPWIFAAVMEDLTGSVEASKLAGYLLLFASFGCVLTCLLRTTGLGPVVAVGLSLAAALNPISLLEAQSFMVDGQLASGLLAVVALTVLALRTGDRGVLAVLAAALVVTVNVKLTAGPYLVLLGGGTLLLGLLFDEGCRKRARAVLATSLVGLAFGSFFVGFNPYALNLEKRGNPIFPIGASVPGDDGVPLARRSEDGMPESWREEGRLQRLALSVFSRSRLAGESGLKVPLALTEGEWKEFRWGGEVRIGGFGPWFGGAMVLAVLVVVRALPKLRGPGVGACLAFLAVLLASVLASPLCWRARFVPQLWLIPVVACGLTLLLPRRRPARVLGAALWIVLMANTLAVAGVHLGFARSEARTLEETLARARDRPQPVAYWLAEGEDRLWFGCRRWFEREGVRLVRVEPPASGEGVPVARTHVRLLLD